jgi:hypothetical protein
MLLPSKNRSDLSRLSRGSAMTCALMPDRAPSTHNTTNLNQDRDPILPHRTHRRDRSQKPCLSNWTRFSSGPSRVSRRPELRRGDSGCRLPSSTDGHRVRQTGGSEPRLSMGQHPAGKPHEQRGGNRPCHSGETRPPLLGSVPIPLQPTLSAGRHETSLAWVALRTAPMPYRLLKLAEICW